MTCVALAVVAGWLTLGPATAFAQPADRADLPPSTVALVERFADGRTVYSLVSQKPGRSWTPMFPRIASWRPPAGVLPIRALQFSRVLVGQNVRVDTTLLLGDAHEQQVHVATVVLTPGARVSIEELRGFGIEPVELSIADAAPVIPTPPSVRSVSAELQIGAVEILVAPYPGYRITVRNLSSRSVANFRVKSYRNGARALSALKSGKGGHPVLLPGAAYSFDLHVTGGRETGDGLWSPALLDLIEVAAVLWDDGAQDGTWADRSPWIVSEEAGRRIQLTRVLELLRATLAQPASRSLVADLKARLEALTAADPALVSVAQRAMWDTKATVLEDVRRFEMDSAAPHSSELAERWLRATIERYESWLSRLRPR